MVKLQLKPSISSLKNNLKFGKIKLMFDVGSFSTRVKLDNQLIYNQPSCFLLRHNNNEVLTIGEPAMLVCGKEPAGAEVIYPVKQGVVYDKNHFNLMISAILKQLKKEISWSWLARAEAVYLIPQSATELDQKIIKQSLLEAGFSKVSLLAKGEALMQEVSQVAREDGRQASKDNQQPYSEDSAAYSDSQIIVIDAGDETTEVVVGAGSTVSFARTLPLGGKKITQSICNKIKQEHDLLISFQQAIKIKHNLQHVLIDDPGHSGKKSRQTKSNQVNVRGVSIGDQTIETQTIHSEEMMEVIELELEQLTRKIRQVLMQVKSEQLISALSNGIILTGGGSKLYGIDDYLAMQLQVNVTKLQ